MHAPRLRRSADARATGAAYSAAAPHRRLPTIPGRATQAALAAAATLLCAAPAGAATVSLTPTAIVITASDGDDDLLISPANGSEPFSYTDTHVDIKDFARPLTHAPGCEVGPTQEPHYLEENEARCPVRAGIVVELGAGKDQLGVYEPSELPLRVPLTVDGGAGDDQITGASAGDVLRGGPGDDLLYGYVGDDVLEGGDGSDQLSGRSGNDHLDGGAGDDRLESEQTKVNIADAMDGADTIIGGPGTDDVSYFSVGANVRVTLDGVADDGRPGERDNIHADVESVGGGFGDDVLIGSDAGHTLWGDLGNDVLTGGAGADRLQGDQGADVLDGRGGDDHLKGGCHDDVITGGPGRDELISDDCFNTFNVGLADRLIANDGEADKLVFCSDARDLLIGDTAIVDAADPVTMSGPGACATVEIVLPRTGGNGPGASGPNGPRVPGGKQRKIAAGLVLITGTGKGGQAPKPSLRLKTRRLTLGTLLSSAGGKVAVTATVKHGRRTLTLGRKTLTLAAGAPQALELKAPASAVKALRAKKKLTVKVAYKVGRKTHRKSYAVAVAR